MRWNRGESGVQGFTPLADRRGSDRGTSVTMKRVLATIAMLLSLACLVAIAMWLMRQPDITNHHDVSDTAEAILDTSAWAWLRLAFYVAGCLGFLIWGASLIVKRRWRI